MRKILALALLACSAHAEPLYRAHSDNESITLYSEPCPLSITAHVSNLPRMATWTEDGKTIQGCYGAHPQLPVIIMYFSSDKKVFLVPQAAFQKVNGI